METDVKYPYYFEKLSEADDALVKSHFHSNSKCRDLGNVSSSMMLRMNFKNKSVF